MRRARVAARGSAAKSHVAHHHTSSVDKDTHAPSGPASRQSSTHSLPGLTPTSTRGGTSSPNLATPSPLPLSPKEYPFYPVPGSGSVSENDVWINGMAPSEKHKKRQSRRVAKFSELERIDSNNESQHCETEDRDTGEDQAAPTPDEPANFFPEQIPIEETPRTRGKKKDRSSKRGSKLVKKSRT
jgi:hypothetical protein